MNELHTIFMINSSHVKFVKKNIQSFPWMNYEWIVNNKVGSWNVFSWSTLWTLYLLFISINVIIFHDSYNLFEMGI
jgi:hypothetical protein